MNPKPIDLRPDRTLLHPNFDGYKLSLNPLSKVKQPTPSPPLRRFASPDQYSFLHSKLFTLHNHLVRDPWNKGIAFYVDTNHTVQAIRYTENSGTLEKCVAVLTLPTLEVESPAGCYNYSIHLVSEKFGVLSDGAGSLILVETGDRYDRGEWKAVYTGRPLAGEDGGFLVQDARLELVDGRKVFHCVLVYVEKNDDVFKAVLDWVVVEQVAGTDGWSTRLQQRLKGRSLPAYCALETKCGALLLGADKSFKVEGTEKDEGLLENVSYGWSQSEDEIIVRFDVADEYYADDFKVVSEAERLTVMLKRRVLFNGDLGGVIDPGQTTWSKDNETLTLTMIKSVAGDVPREWTNLLKDGSSPPAEFLDNGRREVFGVNDIDQLEDCDYDEKGRDFLLERIDATTAQSTHTLNVGKNEPLFTTVLQAGQPPALAQRHDVDVCLWEFADTSPDALQPKHVGTLAALNYVQASKQQKKFVQCSPNFDYAVVAEAQRHIFIYRSQHSSAGNLKNRAGRQVLIGQQMLVTMDPATDPICGLVAENGVLVLLTETQIVCVQIDAS